MKDELPTEAVDNFVAKLKTLAKTCNFCSCLRDTLMHLSFDRPWHKK